MGLFDIFSFKKEANKVFSVENFKHILMTAHDEILCQAEKNEKGEAKKSIVDLRVIEQINTLKRTYSSNKLVLWILDRIIDAVPTITQLIYEFLKKKVERL